MHPKSSIPDIGSSNDSKLTAVNKRWCSVLAIYNKFTNLLSGSNFPIFRNYPNFRLLVPFPHHANPIFFRCSSTLLANFSTS